MSTFLPLQHAWLHTQLVLLLREAHALEPTQSAKTGLSIIWANLQIPYFLTCLCFLFMSSFTPPPPPPTHTHTHTDNRNTQPAIQTKSEKQMFTQFSLWQYPLLAPSARWFEDACVLVYSTDTVRNELIIMCICQHSAYFKFILSTCTHTHTHSHTI